MMKQFQIAIDSMCVAAILSAGAPVLAEEVPDTSGVQLAMEYLLSQDASDNVKVSFRMCDHGDRSGGLLIGYVGLITVPVAYNCYAKGARSCKSGYGVFCMGKIFKWKRLKKLKCKKIDKHIVVLRLVAYISFKF